MAKSENIGFSLDYHPSIHYTGSVKGMKKLGYWDKNDVCARIGNYIYNLSIEIRNPQERGEKKEVSK